YGAKHLEDAVLNASISTILLYTSVQLTEALPEIDRPLVIAGHCENLPEGRCGIDGGRELRIFFVNGGGSLSLFRLELTNGLAEEGSGGAVYLAGSAAASLTSCMLRECEAGKHGGGLYIGGSGNVTLSGSSVIGCVAGTDGGGIYAADGAMVILVNGSSVTNCTAMDDGGGVYVSGSVLMMDGSRIHRGMAADNGGGVFAYAGSRVVLGGGSVVRLCEATDNGGGIYAQDETSVAVDASAVLSNRCTSPDKGLGGGIVGYYDVSILLGSGSVVESNHGRHGGGLYVRKRSSLTSVNSSIAANVAREAGGGIYGYDEVEIAVDNSSISRNVATSDGYVFVRGGGMFGNASRISIAGSSMLNNTATHTHYAVGDAFPPEGGGVCAVESALQIVSSVLAYNQVLGTHRHYGAAADEASFEVAGGYGGGVASIATQTVLHGISVLENFGGEGGGIFFTPYSVVQGSTCASRGLSGLSYVTQALECKLRRTRSNLPVEDEVAWVHDASLPQGCVITFNSSSSAAMVNDGGSGTCTPEFLCYCTSGVELVMRDSDLARNAAAYSGGGMWASGRVSGSNLTVRDNWVKHKDGLGGGIYGYDYTEIVLSNATQVTGNYMHDVALNAWEPDDVYGETGVTVPLDEDSHVEVLTLVAAPPQPPSPPQPPVCPLSPPLPPAPPLQVTNGTADIDGASSAAAHLALALEDAAIHTVRLNVNVTLEAEPRPVTRAVLVAGRCDEAGKPQIHVSGEQQFRVFAVDAGGDLTLECLVMLKGYSESRGGGLHLQGGSSAYMLNSTVRDCHAGLHGGGAFANGSHLVLEGASIEECVAGGSGGGWHGESTSASPVSLQLRGGSTVSNCRATSGDGGGVSCAGYHQMTAVPGVLNDKVLVEEGSEVSANVAGGNGGGLKGEVTCEIEAKLNLTGSSVVSNNVAYGEAGWSSESMYAGRGGGVYASYGDSLHITQGSLVESNFAESRGGGVFTLMVHSVQLAQVDVRHNSAGFRGGGMYLYSGELTQELVTMTGNSAGSQGGGLWLYGIDALLVDCQVAEGRSEEEGAGLVEGNTALRGGGVFSTQSDFTCNGSFVQSNAATEAGGGVYATQGRVTLVGGTAVTGNHAQSGGGVDMDKGVLQLRDGAVLSANHAQADGGGAMLLQSQCTLENGARIHGNSADYGGGVEVFGGNFTVARGSYVTTNHASFGGGVMAREGAAVVVIGGSVLRENHAQSLGGSVYSMRSEVVIMRDSRVEASNGGSEGGAMYAKRSTVKLARSVISSCRARNKGGGLLLTDNTVAEVEDVTFRECSTTQAGGQGGGVSLSVNSSLRATGAVLVGNSAEIGGAMMLEMNGKVDVRGSELRGNSAGKDGGALWVISGGEGALRDTRCSGNSASDSGGGVGLGDSKSTLLIENVTFEAHTAMRGAGVFISRMTTPGLQVRMRLLQFEGNTAVGENIFWTYDPNLTHTPTCEACTHHPLNTSLLATNAVHYSISQEGGLVPAEGVQSSSGDVLAPLTYMAIDFYGNLTSLSTSSGFVVVTSENAILKGETTAVYVPNVGAEVSMLTVTGTPGRSYVLTFSPSQEQWRPVDLTVTLAPCVAGERYLDEEGFLGIAQRQGAGGYLKLTNQCASLTFQPPRHLVQSNQGHLLACALACCGRPAPGIRPRPGLLRPAGVRHPPETWTAPGGRRQASAQDLGCAFPRTAVLRGVVSGSGSGLICYGGSEFVLTDGYWMPEAWIASNCTAAEEVLELVYSCAVPETCAGDAPRVSSGNVSALFNSSLCHAGNRRSTVMCTGCEANHYVMAGSRCASCPSRAWTLSMLVAALVAVVAVVWLLWWLVGWYFGDEAFNQGLIVRMQTPNSSSVIFAVLMGHLQVISQTLTIFSADIVPDVYEHFLYTAEPLNFSVMSWLPFNCIMHALGLESYRVDSFYYTIAFYAFLPLLFALPIVYSLVRRLAKLCGTASHRRQRRESALAPLTMLRTCGASSKKPCVAAEMNVLNPIYQQQQPPQQQLQMSETELLEPGEAAASAGEAAEAEIAGAEIFGVEKGTHGPEDTFEEREETDTEAVWLGLAGFALMYFQPACATHMFGLFNCEVVYLEGKQYWVEMDFQIECYTDSWWAFAVVALNVIGLYILGLPLLLVVAPHYLRKYKRMCVVHSGAIIYVHERQILHKMGEGGIECELNMKDFGVALEAQYEEVAGERVLLTLLQHPQVQMLLRYHLMPFKEKFYYWAAYDMVRKLAQTSLVLLVQQLGDDYDLLYSSVVTTLGLVLHAQARPYVSDLVNLIQLLVLASQSLCVSMLMGEKYAKTDELGSSVVGSVAVLVQVLLTGYMMHLCIKDFVEQNRAALRYIKHLLVDAGVFGLYYMARLLRLTRQMKNLDELKVKRSLILTSRMSERVDETHRTDGCEL
ncbi:hypothetical protein CYMTET_11545, partial [Cymbomonas tetramitiformis]